MIAPCLAGALACTPAFAQGAGEVTIPREDLEALSRAAGHIKYDFVQPRDDSVLVAACAASASLAAGAAAAPPAARAGADLTVIPRMIMDLKASAPASVTYRSLVFGCIRGMVRELDQFSQFYDPDELREAQASFDVQLSGAVGLELTGGGKDPVAVENAIEDAPAWRGGARIGDRLLAIDGRSVDGKTLLELTHALRGKIGSQVTLTLQNTAASEPRKIVLKREMIRYTAAKLAWLEGNVLLLRVPQIRTNARNNVVREIEKFTEGSPRTPEGLVLDLRDNLGGTLSEANGLAALFLPVETTLGSTKGRAPGSNFTYKALEPSSSGGAPRLSAPMSAAFRQVPMAVLVNGHTASSAEMLAAALQANGRAKLAGFPTRGVGALQLFYPLGNEAALKITKVYWYTPKNMLLNGRPLLPDVRMPERLAPGAPAELGPADEALRETVRVLLADR